MKNLMLGLMMAFAVTAEAEVTIDGLKYELDTQNKTATLTGYEGSPTEVNVSTIISEGETYTVTSVRLYAFYQYTSLKKISLPNVTTIGYSAFSRCDSLSSVSLPEAITIEGGAFEYCGSLSSVLVPNVTTIGDTAFEYCDDLTSISLPVATTIGDYAFDGCSSLKEISLPKATEIGMKAFQYCKNLPEISLPKATEIGYDAFYECSLLTSISLPVATTIGDYAFDECSSLKEISLPKATEIGSVAFYKCSSLKTLTVKNYAMKTALEGDRSGYGLDESVTVVNASAVKVGDILYEFDADSDTAMIVGYEGSLTTVDADTVGYQGKTYAITSVGINAFKNCSSMTEISLTNATSVGQGAFSGCSSLSVIVVTKQMKQTLAGNRSRYGIGNNVKIICPPTLTEDQVKNAQYDVKEADVKTEVEVTVITPASVTLKSGGETINEGDYANDCLYYGVTPQPKPETPYTPKKEDFKAVSKDAQVVQEDEIAVKKESIQAPSAGTVTVENNKVQLGVAVLKTSDLTAEKKNWNKVTITKADIDVDADGNIIVNVPVDSASGFMILQSGDAKIETAE